MRVPDNKYCISTSKESDEKFFGIAEDLPLGSPMAGQKVFTGLMPNLAFKRFEQQNQCQHTPYVTGTCVISCSQPAGFAWYHAEHNICELNLSSWLKHGFFRRSPDTEVHKLLTQCEGATV